MRVDPAEVGGDAGGRPPPGHFWRIAVVLGGGGTGFFVSLCLIVLVARPVQDSLGKPASAFVFQSGIGVGTALGALLFHRLARRGVLRPSGPGRPDRRALGAPTWLLICVFLAALGVVGAVVLPALGRRGVSGETAAIAILRNLASCQALTQSFGSIDVDGDRVGEHGTLLERSGATGLRTAADGSSLGKRMAPPVLTQSLARVSPEGFATRAGYHFLIYLPDRSGKGWVHEVGPAERFRMTGAVGTDAAETRWCAYAWPVQRGQTGSRCFFVNQEGDVMQSSNEVARWSGSRIPAPDSALLGIGMTARVAVGTRGRDGDVWKVAN